jgi:hypothetical protein
MQKTDWDLYYQKPYKTASISRRITGNLLVHYIIKHSNKHASILEIGGANSCFYNLIDKKFNPFTYCVMDNNIYGLEKFRQRVIGLRKTNVEVINADILKNVKSDVKYDCVFSVGLVEHFLERDTKVAIDNHFNYVKDDGIVIIAFPTPTFLYKITRKIAELLGLWVFYDERPIPEAEALKIFHDKVTIVEKKIVWSIFLTQIFFVLKKTNQDI